ncbi:MAG TPA: HdeD family acid-resistance protein [Gemmataceae bacterium]|nr:HdeD family acid-resistance protein [Gemmataceae bacterium]
MATDTPPPGGIAAIRHQWGWFLVLGIALILLGTFGLGASVLLTVFSVILFGVILFLGGAIHVVQAFFTRSWQGFLLHALAGILYLVVGLFLMRRPGAGAVGLTLVVAAFLLVGGIFRIVGALALQFPNWGWAALGGFISALLGLLLWENLPSDAEWFLGLWVAIDLLFSGWGWVMFALALRARPGALKEPPPPAQGVGP